MHHRHDRINIPIELLRSFVAIQECGSFTKAASSLQVTQPAISAQIKRLQQLVGGEVFSRGGLGIALTEKGEVVSKYARRILAMNDQIMSLSGAKPNTRHFRIGVPNVYADRMLGEIVKACHKAGQTDRIQFCCEPSGDLIKNLTSGYLDLAFIVSAPPAHAQAITKWTENLVWVCARDFQLEAGSPIPILSWPNAVSDRAAIETLENFGLSYTVAFVASDLAAHLAAIRSGLGFFVLPERVVPPDLRIAREHYLPRLPEPPAGLYLREGLDAKRMAPIIECLNNVLNPNRLSRVPEGNEKMNLRAKPDFA